MEKYHQQFIRYQHCSTRLSHSFSYNTSNNFNTNINYSIFSRPSNTHRSGGSRLIGQISNREGVSSSGTASSRFLQLHVRDPQEEWWCSSGLQPQTAQPVSGGSSLQDGNNQGSVVNDQAKRLSRFNRLIRCIPPCRSPPSVTAIPTVQMEGSGLPILHDRFWFVIKSLCLHQSMQAHFGTLALSRLQDLSLLGRLVAHRQLQASGRISGSPGGISTRGTRMAHQLQEIGATTHSTTGTSRLCIEYPVHDSNSTNQQDEGYTSFNQTSPRQTSSPVSQGYPQPDNAYTGSDICNLSGSTIHPTPLILQESDGEIRCGLGSTSPLGSGQSGGTSMVVSQHPQVEWPVSTAIDTEPNYVCGRQQHGLGLLMESSSCPRVLDSGGGSSVHQLERTEGSSTGPTNVPASPQLHRTDQDRQHNQSDLHQQARRDSLSPSNGACHRSLDMVPTTQHHDPGTAYSRHPQPDCGLRVSTP
ncbi:hypothetical protein MBANPS3_012510, partial [Mucor bainieri]